MPTPEDPETQPALREQVDDCQSSERERLEEQAAADAAMQVQRWSLNQALAWIATRSAIAVGYNRSSDWVCIWARVNPAPYPFAGQGEAWSALGEAIVDGLQGLATKVLCYSDGRLPQEVPGAAFPPEGQPGVFLSYRPSGGRDPVLSPIDRYSYVHWCEYRSLTFRREDVVSRFPATASIENVTSAAFDASEAAEAPPPTKGKRAAYARELIAKAYPNGAPGKDQGKPGEVFQRVLNEIRKGDLRQPPGIDTILRELGWRSR